MSSSSPGLICCTLSPPSPSFTTLLPVFCLWKPGLRLGITSSRKSSLDPPTPTGQHQVRVPPVDFYTALILTPSYYTIVVESLFISPSRV